MSTISSTQTNPASISYSSISVQESSASTSLVPATKKPECCRCMLASSEKADRSYREAFNCFYLSQTFVEVHLGKTIWTHPKIAKLLELTKKPASLQADLLINWQCLHGTTMQRAKDDLTDIENGVRDTFQTASKVDPVKLGYKADKVIQGIFFSHDISLVASYAWPLPAPGKEGEKGQPAPVIFDVLIGTEDTPAVMKFNEYQKSYTDGSNVYPIKAQEYLGKTRHTMCQPAKQKLVNLSKWGLGGVAVATSIGLGKTIYDYYPTSRVSSGAQPTPPSAAGTISPRISDEQFDTYAVSGS